MFSGYWRNEQATNATFEDGWFRTGDIGHLDNDGFLYITGRKKDLIVTASGKNVAPAVLEDRLREHWLIEECVVGDKRPYVAVPVTLDMGIFGQWKADRRKPAEATVAEMREDPELLSGVRLPLSGNQTGRVSGRLPRWKSTRTRPDGCGISAILPSLDRTRRAWPRYEPVCENTDLNPRGVNGVGGPRPRPKAPTHLEPR